MYAGDYTDSELSLYLFIFKVFSCFVKWYTKGILIGKLAGIFEGICIEGIVKAC